LGNQILFCISGDIGYSGTEKDYIEAAAWLTRLLEITNLKPSQIIPMPETMT